MEAWRDLWIKRSIRYEWGNRDADGLVTDLVKHQTWVVELQSQKRWQSHRTPKQERLDKI